MNRGIDRITARITRVDVRSFFGAWRRLFLILAICAASVGSLRADLAPPSVEDRAVTKEVAGLLEMHLSGHPLDNEISERTLKLYLESLDPGKLFFQQSDIDSFNRNKDDIDDFVSKGDLGFAHQVAETYLARVKEREALAEQLIDADFDFGKDESMVVDPKNDHYPADDTEAREKWRKRIKWEMLLERAEDATDQEIRDKLKRRYQRIAKERTLLNNEELREIFLTSLAKAYDPNMDYMSPDTIEEFDIIMKLDLEGIGAQLKSEDGYTVVTKVIPGGAAEKHGKLKPGDKIVGVGQGENGEIEDVVDMSLRRVVKLIRGRPGTSVRLQVIPDGSKERTEMTITRARIELKDQEAQGEVFEVGSKPDGSAYKVGVLDVPGFYLDFDGARKGYRDYKSVTRDSRKILNEFKQQGVDVVVVDLRSNTGGALPEAVSLTGLFIDQGPVVQVRDHEGRIHELPDSDRGVLWDGPLVVMVNKLSASASEIFAGAIQDYHRGIVVGDPHTYGKGTVQQMLDVGESIFGRLFGGGNKLGSLKVTIQQYYRPNGESTQLRGVVSDITLPSFVTHIVDGEADADYAFEWNRIDPAQYQVENWVRPDIVTQLKARSEDRVGKSEDFQKLTRRIERYLKRKEEKSVTLNEQKFLDERKEFDSEKEQEKVVEEISQKDDDKIVRDYYLDEVLAMAVDYFQLLRDGRLAQVN